jgi:hypothetical protein
MDTNKIEIIDPKASDKISAGLVLNKAEDLTNSINMLQNQIISQGLGDLVTFDGTKVIMDIDNFATLFKVYSVSQNRLIDSKDQNLDDLRGVVKTLSDLTMSKETMDDFQKCINSTNKQMLDLTTALKNNALSKESDIVKQLLDIIQTLNNRVYIIEGNIVGTCKATNNLITSISKQINKVTKHLDDMEDNVKSLAGSYMLKHKKEIDPNYKPGRHKKVEDDLFKQLYVECNGNICQVRRILHDKYQVDISWQSLHTRAVNLGFK